jgi:hypothetical protein
MNLRTRLRKLEERTDRGEKECADHEMTCIISFGHGRNDGRPDGAPAPPCAKCGKPGTILEIIDEIEDGRTVEELLASSPGGLTMDDILFAEALAADAGEANDDAEHQQ